MKFGVSRSMIRYVDLFLLPEISPHKNPITNPQIKITIPGPIGTFSMLTLYQFIDPLKTMP